MFVKSSCLCYSLSLAAKRYRSYATRPPIVDRKLLQVAIEKYGGDFEKIGKECFPDVDKLGLMRLVLNHRPGILGRLEPFTLQEDRQIMAIMKVSKTASGAGTVPKSELALKLNRSFNSIQDRVQFIRTKAMLLGKEREIPLRDALAWISSNLGSLSRISSNPEAKWTNEMDEKLLRLIDGMGPAYDYLVYDFPQFKKTQIATRHNYLSGKIFLPFEDEMIKEIFLNHPAVPRKREDLLRESMLKLPQYPFFSIMRRKDKLDKGDYLSEEMIFQLSKGLEEFGSEFLYTINFSKETNLVPKGWDYRRLRCEWAVNEPFNQVNPTWSIEKDAKLARYANLLMSTKSEFERLKKSPLKFSLVKNGAVHGNVRKEEKRGDHIESNRKEGKTGGTGEDGEGEDVGQDEDTRERKLYEQVERASGNKSPLKYTSAIEMRCRAAFLSRLPPPSSRYYAGMVARQKDILEYDEENTKK